MLVDQILVVMLGVFVLSHGKRQCDSLVARYNVHPSTSMISNAEHFGIQPVLRTPDSRPVCETHYDLIHRRESGNNNNRSPISDLQSPTIPQNDMGSPPRPHGSSSSSSSSSSAAEILERQASGWEITEAITMAQPLHLHHVEHTR